jgi:N-methylhydantoinase A
MKYSAQVFDIEVPIRIRGKITAHGVGEIAEDFARVYERLHGSGSGHPEGGIEITGFILRGRGLTDPPRLAAPQAGGSPQRTSRQVYWHELDGFADTPVLRLESGTVREPLEGPLLIELPDTVIVLRPAQTADFAENGSLVIDV